MTQKEGKEALKFGTITALRKQTRQPSLLCAFHGFQMPVLSGDFILCIECVKEVYVQAKVVQAISSQTTKTENLGQAHKTP